MHVYHAYYLRLFRRPLCSVGERGKLFAGDLVGEPEFRMIVAEIFDLVPW